MSIIIGSARLGENGKITGGVSGDQKQTGSGNDYKGEVSMQDFYVHKKGWYVLRAKNPDHAEKIADLMILACNNPHIGYDQNGRLGIIQNGINSTINTECDCSSLVREIVREATGKDPGNFTTSNESSILEKTGLFDGKMSYSSGMKLFSGDILVTKTKGHTAIVVSGESRTINTTSSNKNVSQVAREVIMGKWGTGDTRKKRLTNAGYNYAEVQAEVNKMLRK